MRRVSCETFIPSAARTLHPLLPLTCKVRPPAMSVEPDLRPAAPVPASLAARTAAKAPGVPPAVTADYGTFNSGAAGVTGGRSGDSGGSGGGSGRDDSASGSDWASRRGIIPWLVSLAKGYVGLLDSSPLLTKTATSGALGGVSDLLAQWLESRRRKDSSEPWSIEWRRAGALAVVGALLTAPMFHALYEFLEHALPASAVGWKAWRNTAAQLAVDQLIAAPVWLLCFYAMFSTIEKGTFVVEDLKAQIRRDFLPSIKLTWTVFPVFQLISFAVLPKNMRVLVLNVIDLGYTAALSMISHT
jgi:hypothetical protein